MGIISKLKEMFGSFGQPPKLDPDYCPICGRRMKQNSHNIQILSDMGYSECYTCDISYSGFTGHQTSKKSVAEKCRKIGYKVSNQGSSNGVYRIRD